MNDKSSTYGFALLALPLLLTLVACDDNGKKAQREEPARPVRVQSVEFKTDTQRLTLAGVVAPRIESGLGFRVPGKVVAREVELGQRVVAGQPLLRLDPADLQEAVDGARAQFAAAEAESIRAKSDLDRYEGLKGTAAHVQQQHDLRRSAADSAAARLDQTRSSLRNAKNNLSYATLLADADGVVTGLSVEVGQVIAAGQSIVRVARLDELEIQTAAPEQRLLALQASSRISVQLWADPGKRHAVRLRELAASADPATRTYPARFSFVERPAYAALGMTAVVVLERDIAENVAELPLTAIYQSGRDPAVWVLDKATSTVSIRPVAIARWRDDTVLVASGVRAGDLVVTAGVHKLESGQKVRSRDGATSAPAQAAAPPAK
jgi:multidrug efflux system membrane fusion protein